MMPCQHCGPPSVDVTRDVLDLAAAVLSGASLGQHRAVMARLLQTPETSIAGMATLLLAVSRPAALEHVRWMAALHQLQVIEGEM
jgi:hypothetical protein